MGDRKQPRPGTSLPMSIIKESGQVSVSDSNLTVAGGHANHIEFNITLSTQPSPETKPPVEPMPRSLWSMLLGKWLVGPQTTPLLPLAPPNPGVPETPSHEPMEGRPCPPPLLPSTHSSGIAYCETANKIEVVPLNHLDIHAQLALSAAPVQMPHEIYVSHLYPRGHGYPCANPKPRGDPVRIGDIGFVASDQFNVLVNLLHHQFGWVSV
ncbi:hypothetical protein BKA70DRAFT_1255265 [Coprinopsis sp. MPI-PUGE-AT-0042]|nr:hypothetical protein BKA70DRAFT_1255265 [Coprinopsis sp. MPI-PUGE-AT-0042]